MRDASQILQDSKSAPVSRVPNELLSYIFSQGSHPLTPVLVSHICRRWRLVATRDPRLWTRATLYITARTREQRLCLLDLFLSRSANQQLEIYMYLDPFKNPEELQVCIVQRALAVLLTHAWRWGSLHLSLPVTLFGSALCEYLEAASGSGVVFPILKSACITLGGRQDPGQGSTPVFEPSANMLLARAPALRELEWTYQSNRTSYDRSITDSVKLCPSEAWEGLTSVVLNRTITAPLALAVLKNAPRIELFRLRSLVDGEYEDGERQTVQAPASDVHMHSVHSDDDERTVARALRALSVYQLQMCSALPWLLSRLVCPALHSLSLSCGFYDGEQGELLGRELALFLQHCAEAVEVEGHSLSGAVNGMEEGGVGVLSHSPPNAGLQELLLEGMGVAPAHLTACLSHTKDLRRLQIEVMHGIASVDDMVLQALTGRSKRSEQTDMVGGKSGTQFGPAPLCPRLTALVLGNSISCTDGALAAMLRPRVPLLNASQGGTGSRMDIMEEADWEVAPLEELSIELSKAMRETNLRDAIFLYGPLKDATHALDPVYW